MRSAGGRSYLARIQPYRTTDNVIDGVVLTFPDVTDRLQAIATAKAHAIAEAVVDAAPIPLVVLDPGAIIVSANQAYRKLFGGTPQSTGGHGLFTVQDGRWDLVQVRELVQAALRPDIKHGRRRRAKDAGARHRTVRPRSTEAAHAPRRRPGRSPEPHPAVDRTPGRGGQRAMMSARKPLTPRASPQRPPRTGRSCTDPDGHTPALADTAAHEIQVHRIELEMQNQELRRTQAALEAARDRYADLYDFAPVGYLTLAASGQIVEANLTCSQLLGIARATLTGSLFSRRVVEVDRDRWHRHQQRLGGQTGTSRIELTLMRGDGHHWDAQLDCLPARPSRVRAAHLPDPDRHQRASPLRSRVAPCRDCVRDPGRHHDHRR